MKKTCFKKEISIIGTGRAGTSLAYSLKKKGWKILYLFDRDLASALESKKILREGKIENIKKIIDGGDFFILSVHDNELENISRVIAEKNNLKNKTFIHLSGSISYKVLLPLKEKGGHIGALHPIFPFPTKKTDIPDGVYFGWEGEEKALKKSLHIVKDLKGKLIRIKIDKALYHLACSIASNLTSILYMMALEKSKEAGLDEKKAKELLFQLCWNSLISVKERGWEGVTGPALRGDKETILKHLKNLLPREKKIYKEILLYFLEKGTIKEAEKIVEFLEEKNFTI